MKRFGTFEGVFIPCLLSILGVIMYLRLGWVIGSAGLGGTLMIIALSNFITLSTALSMSSIVTNIRIGAGGAYSIITKSLGVEAGGAIGIPLYISQAVSVAFYITGFTECWVFVFPEHNALLVGLITWLMLLTVSFVSAKLAFRIQYVILGIIFLSLISVFASDQVARQNVMVWDGFRTDSFWPVFAIFFPAVTGVLAGAAMSGELKDPKISIPRGTLSAIFVSIGIYTGLALWFAFYVPRLDLLQNTSVLIDLGRWRWLVIAGIMGATLSSALSMFIGSPRTLLALGKHMIVPMSKSFTHISKKGEPTTAILFTSFLVLVTILLGTLDQVAELLTMIFLITYGMINLTVFIEQTIGIASFRPSFRVWRILPLLGSAGCFIVMFCVNAQFSLIAIVIILLTYISLVRKEVKVRSPDVRSGMLMFIAEQFAKASSRLPYHPKIWKPNLLIPVSDLKILEEVIPLIRDIVAPGGRLIFFQIIPQGSSSKRESLNKELSSSVSFLKEEGLFVENSVIESQDLLVGASAVIQMVKGMFFPPNTLFCVITEQSEKDHLLKDLIYKSADEGLALIVLQRHPKFGFSQEKVINLWIRKNSPNFNLSILVSLQLDKNWEGNLRLIQIVDSPEEINEARSYLEKMKERMRMPHDVEVEVRVGEFKKILKEAPPADINIFGMPDKPDLDMVRFVFTEMKTSVLFLRDSKHESAVA